MASCSKKALEKDWLFDQCERQLGFGGSGRDREAASKWSIRIRFAWLRRNNGFSMCRYRALEFCSYNWLYHHLNCVERLLYIVAIQLKRSQNNFILILYSYFILEKEKNNLKILYRSETGELPQRGDSSKSIVLSRITLGRDRRNTGRPKIFGIVPAILSVKPKKTFQI